MKSPPVCSSTIATSENPEGVAMSINGSNIQVTCDVLADISCVLVIREYGNTTLVIKEFNETDKPPPFIPLDNPNSSYTIALFEKDDNTGIAPEPVTTGRYIPNSTIILSCTTNHSSGKEFISILLL